MRVSAAATPVRETTYLVEPREQRRTDHFLPVLLSPEGMVSLIAKFPR